MIDIYIDSAYPSTDDIHIHELNTNGSLKKKIAFWNNNEAFDLTEKTVTATIVINNELIVEDVSCSNITGVANAIELDLTSNNNYSLAPGKMLVEFKIAESGEKNLYPAMALVINVHSSIRDNAQVTPESYGTISEILQEVAIARGTFQNLNARLNDINDKALNSEVGNSRLATGAVNYNKLDTNLKNTVDNFNNNGVTYKNETISSLSTLNSSTYLSEKVVYKLQFTGTAASDLGYTVAEMSVVPYSSARLLRVMTFPLVEGIKMVQTVTPSGGGSWTYGEWIEKRVDLDTIPNITVWDYETSQTNNFTVPTSFEGKLGDIVVVTTGTGTGGKSFELKKIVTSSGVTSYFWEDNISTETVEDEFKPTYSASFLQSGMIDNYDHAENELNIYSQNAVRIYVSPLITTISASILQDVPNVRTFYVDKKASEISIASEILNNQNITIYYKGEFNTQDLFILSQFATANKLKQLETLVGTVNTMLENAVSGVS